MFLKITVFCVVTLQMVPFAYTKDREIINNKPQLAEKRKNLSYIDGGREDEV